jgi:hypothetical protein
MQPSILNFDLAKAVGFRARPSSKSSASSQLPCKLLATVSREPVIRELDKSEAALDLFALPNRFEDVQTRFADNITDDVAQLHIHFEERLLHVVDGLSTGNCLRVVRAQAYRFVACESADQAKRSTSSPKLSKL